MRLSRAVLAYVGLFLSGCASTENSFVWSRSGNYSASLFQDHRYACEKESYSVSPINNQLHDGGFGKYYTSDENEEKRAEFWTYCMKKKGWYLVSQSKGDKFSF